MAKLSRGIVKQIEDAVSANPDANVSLLDSDGIYRYIGPAATAILGYTKEEIQNTLGQPFTATTHAREITHLTLAFQDAILNGESVMAPRQVKLKSGGFRRMIGSGRRIIDEDNGEVYVLVIGKPAD